MTNIDLLKLKFGALGYMKRFEERKEVLIFIHHVEGNDIYYLTVRRDGAFAGPTHVRHVSSMNFRPAPTSFRLRIVNIAGALVTSIPFGAKPEEESRESDRGHDLQESG